MDPKHYFHQDRSMVSFGGHRNVQGCQNIDARPWSRGHPSIPSADSQPSGMNAVFVNGDVQLSREHSYLKEFFKEGSGTDPDAWAREFVGRYYETFDTNRSGLRNFYGENSILSFEGYNIQGSQNIIAGLTSLPFNECHHFITTVDCQPSGVNAGMLVFVTGNLKLSGEQHAHKFTQMFHLIPTPQGSYYVLNDIFRLN